MIRFYGILENVKPREQKTDQWTPWAAGGGLPQGGENCTPTLAPSLLVLLSQAFSESRSLLPQFQGQLPGPHPSSTQMQAQRGQGSWLFCSLRPPQGPEKAHSRSLLNDWDISMLVSLHLVHSSRVPAFLAPSWSQNIPAPHGSMQHQLGEV